MKPFPEQLREEYIKLLAVGDFDEVTRLTNGILQVVNECRECISIMQKTADFVNEVLDESTKS